MFAPDQIASTAEQAKMLMPFGFTERQARFLAVVLLHSGIFMGRHYAAFAGITHGQKVHDFVERLLAGRFATAHRVGRTGRTRLFHVQHKPLYAALGEPDNRHRKPISLGRAVERMMLLDAVLTDREVVWLATERDKWRHFVLHLRGRLREEDYPRLVFGKGDEQTVRHFPDKLPIGVNTENGRHIFVFLAADRTPMDFRQFLLRHAELLIALHRWTIRVILPRERADLRRVYEAAVYDQLWHPLPSSFMDDVLEIFRRRREGRLPGRIRLDTPTPDVHTPSGSALTALYRRWLEVGDEVVSLARSPAHRDALERGQGDVECVVLSHRYGYLSSLAGTS